MVPGHTLPPTAITVILLVNSTTTLIHPPLPRATSTLIWIVSAETRSVSKYEMKVDHVCRATRPELLELSN